MNLLLCLCSLVAAVQPFAGMRHLDVAGGTGDVAFRVLRTMQVSTAHHALLWRVELDCS